MKVFVVFAFCGLFAASYAGLSEEQQKKIAEHHAICKKSSGVSDEIFQKAKTGPYPDDQKFAAHMLCVSKRAGFQNDAGEFQKDVILTKVNSVVNDETKVKALFDKCINNKKDTIEKSTVAVLQCFKDNTGGAVSLL